MFDRNTRQRPEDEIHAYLQEFTRMVSFENLHRSVEFSVLRCRVSHPDGDSE